MTEAKPPSIWDNVLQTPGAKKVGAHNERNQEVIRQQLLAVLPHLAPGSEPVPTVRVLEVACGTGQHAAYLSSNLANVHWTPTDFDQVCVLSTIEWTRDLPNVDPARLLDVCDASTFPAAQSADLVYNCNMIHIAPSEVTTGLANLAAHALAPGGHLALYGPFKLNGEHTAPTNAEFDEKLRSRDPSWGIRDYEAVDRLLGSKGLTVVGRFDLPANNMLCVWQRNAQ